ncbi:MAG: response regulator [Candidatus Saccharimonas sp.]|nr:response regulator [Planctomycetaceae bacterium]
MTHETVGRPMEILLVEDSLTFARLAIGALKNGQVPHRLTWLTDGADAWEFLKRRGPYANAPRPDLLLLDLKLPGLDGTELLARLRADGDLKTLPVIVMTGEGDSFSASGLPVEAFLTKPLAFDKFIEIVRKLSAFWQADMLTPVHATEPPVVEDDELLR